MNEQSEVGAMGERTLRKIPEDVQSTHWPDSDGHRGCWSEHALCAVLKVETLQAALVASEAREARAVEALAAVAASLNAIEWRPAMSMKGTMKNFCPVCHGTPGIYEHNKLTARPDGHWTQTVPWPHGCPLAAALDQVRAVLRSHDAATAEGRYVAAEQMANAFGRLLTAAKGLEDDAGFDTPDGFSAAEVWRLAEESLSAYRAAAAEGREEGA